MERCDEPEGIARTLVIVTSVGKESNGRALTKWRRNGAHAQACKKSFYRSPCDRNRVTGSTTVCRLKIQRATAKPIAA